MKKIAIYTTTYCSYCTAAKKLLSTYQLPFMEIDVTNDDTKRAWLIEKTGSRTVPQIFVDDIPIGGFTELSALIQENGITTLV